MGEAGWENKGDACGCVPVSRQRSNRMVKSLFICSTAIAVLVIGWAGWKLRPLTPAGKTVCLGNWKFNDYEMQIWQSKNASLSEPFSTSFYVRHQTNAWHQYYLNHQDTYAPHYFLTRTNEMMLVCRDGKQLGAFNFSTGKYERVGGGIGLEDVFWRNPP